MTWDELITTAINTAVAGTDADNNPIIKQRLEAAAMTDAALQALAVEAAGNPEMRSRLERQSSVALTSGVGAIPAGMLTEYLREGVVRDSSGSGVGGLGNTLARVNRYSTFISDQDTALGLYCLVDNSIYARPPGSVFPSDTIGPLLIDAPFAPTTSDLQTTVPDELINNMGEILARRLRGMIAPSVAPV